MVVLHVKKKEVLGSLPPIGVIPSGSITLGGVERSVASQKTDLYFLKAAAKSSKFFCFWNLQSSKFFQCIPQPQYKATEFTRQDNKLDQPDFFWGNICLVLIMYGFLFFNPFGSDPLGRCAQSCAFLTPLFADWFTIPLSTLHQPGWDNKENYIVVSCICLRLFGVRCGSNGRVFTSCLTPLFLDKCAILGGCHSDMSLNCSSNQLGKAKITDSKEINPTVLFPLIAQWANRKIFLFLHLFLFFSLLVIDADKNCLGRIVVASSDSITSFYHNKNNSIVHQKLAVVDLPNYVGVTAVPAAPTRVTTWTDKAVDLENEEELSIGQT